MVINKEKGVTMINLQTNGELFHTIKKEAAQTVITKMENWGSNFSKPPKATVHKAQHTILDLLQHDLAWLHSTRLLPVPWREQ